MSTETWKPIPGYMGKYEVSDAGRVRSLLTDRTLRLQSNGRYLHVRLSDGGDIRLHLVHRLVMHAFVGTNETKRSVNHLNGIKTDNHLSNLEWTTPAENSAHAIQAGLIQRGESHPRRKLDDNKVRLIRHAINYDSSPNLAALFGVPRSTIMSVVNRKTWAHVA